MKKKKIKLNLAVWEITEGIWGAVGEIGESVGLLLKYIAKLEAENKDLKKILQKKD